MVADAWGGWVGGARSAIMLTLVLVASGEAAATGDGILNGTALEATGHFESTSRVDAVRISWIDRGDGLDSIIFHLQADRMEIVRDMAPAISASGVVARGESQESQDELTDAVMNLHAWRSGGLVYLVPLDPTRAAASFSRTVWVPVDDQTLSMPRFVNENRAMPDAPLEGALSIRKLAGELVLRGNLFLSAWDVDFQGHGAGQGDEIWKTGMVDARGTTLPSGQAAETGTLVQMQIVAYNATVRIQAAGIQSLEVYGLPEILSGQGSLALAQATGSIALGGDALKLQGEAAILNGSSLRLSDVSQSAGLLSFRASGIDEATTGSRSIRAVSTSPDFRDSLNAPLILLFGLAALLACVLVYYLTDFSRKSQGGYRSAKLNIAQGLLDERKWQAAIVVLNVWLRNHDDCPDGHRMRAEAHEALGHHDRALCDRRKADQLLAEAEDLVDNAYAASLSAVACGRREEAAGWLGRAVRADPGILVKAEADPRLEAIVAAAGLRTQARGPRIAGAGSDLLAP